MNSADWHMSSWKKHGNLSSSQVVQPPNCDFLIRNTLGDSFLSDYVEKFPCLMGAAAYLFKPAKPGCHWTALLNSVASQANGRLTYQDWHFQTTGVSRLNQSQPFPFDPMNETSKIVVSLPGNDVLCEAL
ncbi:unnamed protein product [Urochloa humidicola]